MLMPPDLPVLCRDVPHRRQKHSIGHVLDDSQDWGLSGSLHCFFRYRIALIVPVHALYASKFYASAKILFVLNSFLFVSMHDK